MIHIRTCLPPEGEGIVHEITGLPLESKYGPAGGGKTNMVIATFVITQSDNDRDQCILEDPKGNLGKRGNL